MRCTRSSGRRAGRTVVIALAGSLAAAGTASAAASETVESDQAVARGCHDAYVDGAAGTDTFRYTAPAAGIVRATLKGEGDWDLALFDAASGRAVAAAAGYESDELAEGYVTEGQQLIVQACRYRGWASSAQVAVDTIGTPSASATGTAQLVAVDTPSRTDKRRLQSLGLDLTEHADASSVDVVLHGEQDVQTLSAAGFTYDVKVADLAAQSRRFAAADRE